MGGRRAAIGESNQVLLAIGGGGGRVVAKLGQPAKLITPSRSSQAASFVSASMRLAEPFAQRVDEFAPSEAPFLCAAATQERQREPIEEALGRPGAQEAAFQRLARQERSDLSSLELEAHRMNAVSCWLLAAILRMNCEQPTTTISALNESNQAKGRRARAPNNVVALRAAAAARAYRWLASPRDFRLEALDRSFVSELFISVRINARQVDLLRCKRHGTCPPNRARIDR